LLKKLKQLIYGAEGKEEYKKIFVTQRSLIKNRYQDGKDRIVQFSIFDRYINSHKEKECFLQSHTREIKSYKSKK
jgi:hypothetical protein